jgi:hypothetical protein
MKGMSLGSLSKPDITKHFDQVRDAEIFDPAKYKQNIIDQIYKSHNGLPYFDQTVKYMRGKVNGAPEHLQRNRQEILDMAEPIYELTQRDLYRAICIDAIRNGGSMPPEYIERIKQNAG